MTGIGGFASPVHRERFLEAYRDVLDACPRPREIHDVDTGHGTTRVYRHGEGDAPPIVLLHGFFGTSAMWEPHVRAFAEQRPVYAVDILGEPGGSVQVVPFEDVPARARWLDEVLAGLGLTEVHLVGASMGGWLAFNQALHAPARLASVTLLDATTVVSRYAGAVLWRCAWAALLRREEAWRRFLVWSLDGDESAMDRLDVRMGLLGLRGYQVGLPPPVRPADDQVRSVRLPVLALFGARSVAHDAAAAAERARRLMPGAEVELWPDTGHHMSRRAVDRDRINERVPGFVRAVSSSRSGA